MFSPAHSTKHISLLHYPFADSTFHLAQLDDGVSNGTALWLGASHSSSAQSPIRMPPRLVELGSGIGLTALAMSSLGWDVVATDIPHVISSVLADNIENNLQRLPAASGTINVRELDWNILPDHWTWDNAAVIASQSPPSSDNNSALLSPPFDVICSADTVYTPALPHLVSARAPPVYLCIERRDPALVDRVLADAHNTWGFNVERIPHRKLTKVMDKAGIKWPKEEWEGVEIWKFTLP
ncbi:hypothetical protein FPV67DRAFT_1557450 [Lyophyllum atratum]|nr:hypothetical protein FPV67DRAFT_1557450 [Lyophyllum atratum]